MFSVKNGIAVNERDVHNFLSKVESKDFTYVYRH